MTLEQHLRENEDLTGALRAALADGDDDACARLLAQREAALTGLAGALRLATPATRHALKTRLASLGEADRDLRRAAADCLARLGEATRAGFGLAGRPATPASSPDTIPCVDRLA